MAPNSYGLSKDSEKPKTVLEKIKQKYSYSLFRNLLKATVIKPIWHGRKEGLWVGEQG